VWHAARQGAEHVVQRGGAARRHQADAARQRRQRALAGGVEQALGLQPRLQPQELLEQRALAGALHGFHHQLQVAARLVHRQAPAHLDRVTLARHELQQPGGAAEHGAAQLAGVVLEREITVPTGSAREARHLAAHRHRVEARLQQIRHGSRQRPNRPDARRQCWRCRFKPSVHALWRPIPGPRPRQYSTARRPPRSASGHPPETTRDRCKPLISNTIFLMLRRTIGHNRGGRGWNRPDRANTSQSYPQHR